MQIGCGEKMPLRLYLRPVELKDAEQLFQWRNEKSVRENSFSMEPIQYEEHMRWFKNALNDTEQFFFILMMNDIAIGQIRVKREGNLGIINYSIATQYRAQGYGKKMLILIENYFVQADIQLVLTAYVKAKNIASQRIFEDLGYVLLEHSDVFCYEKKQLRNMSIEDDYPLT